MDGSLGVVKVAVVRNLDALDAATPSARLLQPMRYSPTRLTDASVTASPTTWHYDTPLHWPGPGGEDR